APRAALRTRSAAAGERLLVAQHVQPARPDTRCQSVEALPDQFSDAAGFEARCRWRADAPPPARHAGRGDGVQLPSDAAGPVLRAVGDFLAQACGPRRLLDQAAAGEGAIGLLSIDLEFGAPVLRAAFLRAVVGNGLRFAQTRRLDAAAIDTVLH